MRAIERGEQHQPARPHQRRAGLQERGRVGHVLHHLQAHHRIERQALGRQLLHRPGAISDLEALAGGMAAGRLDVLHSRIEPRHLRPQARQRLRYQPSAAAHVEHAQALRAAACPAWPRPKWRCISSRRNWSRAGPIRCRARNLPRASHHCEESRAKRSISAASSVAEEAPGVPCCIGELARCAAPLSRLHAAPGSCCSQPALWL